MNSFRIIAPVVMVLASIVCAPMPNAIAADKYDLVILNGRVMDPESGLDEDRNIGVKDSKVLKGVYPGKPIRLPVQN